MNESTILEYMSIDVLQLHNDRMDLIAVVVVGVVILIQWMVGLILAISPFHVDDRGERSCFVLLSDKPFHEKNHE
jgi:hypothetical protein